MEDGCWAALRLLRISTEVAVFRTRPNRPESLRILQRLPSGLGHRVRGRYSDHDRREALPETSKKAGGADELDFGTG